MWIIIVIFVIIIIVIAIVGSNANKTEQQTLVLAANELRGKGFASTENTKLEHKILAWDKQNEKIALITYQHQNYNAEIFDYSSIRDAEIIKNGETIFKKSTMRTVGGVVIGGVLLGGVGAIVGGLSGSSKGKEKINSLTLKIYFNSVENPSNAIEFINKTTLPSEKERLIKEAEKWKDRLIAIIDKGRLETKTELFSNALTSLSVADELKKYKDLLDSGAITVDEFNSQKAKLLS